MMRWHARTARASSLAATSIVIGGGFFLPFFLPLVLGEDVVLLSGGGGGGASPALGFFLRGFGFFAFCGSSPFDMTSMTIALSSSLLPFLGRGGMCSGIYRAARRRFGSPMCLLLEVGVVAFAGDKSVGSAAIAAIAQCRRDALWPQRERR